MDKVKFKGGDWRLRAAMADEASILSPRELVSRIKELHARDEWERRNLYLLEVERQVQEHTGIPQEVGLTASQWSQALGITQRHQDCEGLQSFNHGFEVGSLWGAITMLECDRGGSPPTTDQFIERERSGEWYPRACR